MKLETIKRGLVLCLASGLSSVLADGGAVLAPGSMNLPFETLSCRSGQTLQLIPSNTQSLMIRRYRGRRYALNDVLGTQGRYRGQGMTVHILPSGALDLSVGRVHDLCPHPNAGH
ncbi:hypothetical protein FNU79_10555 [Deinococcus detaillensis]|uniref:C-type lysozyme inhibitor domain-containing protein n=1 Tax=Deinococcus detaillensis TaxID=2592048 RepID=A0A553UWU4_9DEIO|nr:hypothetical protein [Deinococcus detaillensis]TSA84666.1 hypothetical protein FNU79_10555 [Deinococcus detaillensis]